MYRFKIRTLLLATLVAAMVISAYTNRALRQRRAVDQLLSKNAKVFYTLENGVAPNQQFLASNSDFWYHFFYSVELVILQPTSANPADDQVQIVSRLPTLDYLSIWPGGVKKDVNWGGVNTFDNQPASFDANGGLTDVGLNHVMRELGHLKEFHTTSVNCSKEKLMEFEQALKNAQDLYVVPRKGSDVPPLVKSQ